MSENKYMKKLGEPFPYSDVNWRLQYVNTKELSGIAVPYLDARAIEDRLDNVIGQNNWKDEYEQWHTYLEKVEEHGKVTTKQVQSQICKISIYDEERKEWIDKSDGAENTDIEAIKGGLSDAFKRAAVKWNIGRYMYKMNTVWVKVKQQGKNYVIDTSDNNSVSKMTAEYNRVIREVFGTAVTNGNPNNNSSGNQQPQQETNVPKTQTNGTSQSEVYEVKNIKVQANGDMVQSQLVLSKGQNTSIVFMKGSDDNLKIGTKLKNVTGHKGQNSYGQYYVLESYEIAA